MNKGVVGLTRWIEKMEFVFVISFCAEDCKVKFAICTLTDTTLTWWNSYTRTMVVSIANSMSWNELNQFMIEDYCTCEEMQILSKNYGVWI